MHSAVHAYAVARCLSVCHKAVCFETAQRIELVFSSEETIRLFDTVLKGNSGISKMRVYFPLELCYKFSPIFCFFRRGKSIVASVVKFDHRTFITMSAHFCLQHVGRDASYVIESKRHHSP